MNPKAVWASYACSLAWLAVLAAVIPVVSIVVELVLVDFIHGNPHRTRENTVEMLILDPPFLGLLAVLATILVFTLPQCVQALVSGALVGRFGNQARAGVLLGLPLTAILTWYCWDCLTPVSLLISQSPADTLYRHGLTRGRYFGALAFQAPATLFSVAYDVARTARRTRRALTLLALLAAVTAGVVLGWRDAQVQYQYS